MLRRVTRPRAALGDIGLLRWANFSSVGVPVAQSVLGDNELLNIHRPLDDLISFGVAIVALHGKFRGIAVSAEYLERTVRAKSRRLAAGGFRHRDFPVVRLAAGGGLGGAGDPKAGRPP